jgi:serine/threonine-protein kinase
LLESLLKTAERVYISPARIALFNLALGREDAALNWLERAVTVHAVDLVWIGVHPHYDPIRNQPRFVNLLRAVGLAPLIPETVNETEQRA